MESMRNFLKAIDHMEFHPTLGKEKKGTSFKLRKRSLEGRCQYGSSIEISEP